jgi:Protein  of unknown function (DUF3018)
MEERISVPNKRSARFAAEARRQSAAVAGSPDEADDQAFIDAISNAPHPVPLPALRGEGTRLKQLINGRKKRCG